MRLSTWLGHRLRLDRRGVRWIAEPGLPHMIATVPGGIGGRAAVSVSAVACTASNSAAAIRLARKTWRDLAPMLTPLVTTVKLWGMESGRPVIGLDVDGVLTLETPALTEAHLRWVSAWGRWRRAVVVPDLAACAVQYLSEYAEIVWVSAWGHNAHAALRETLGLPEAPWSYLPVQFGQASALAAYAGPRPWALIHDGTDQAPARSEGIVVSVDARRGIAEIDPEALIHRLRSMATVATAHRDSRERL